MRYGLGYRPDPHQCRPPAHLLLKAGPALPAAASLLDRAPRVLDQSNTGSCAGHAGACGIYVALGLDWVPSPAEMYRNGRALDRVHPNAPLSDEGAMPSAVFRAVNAFGVRPMVPLASRFSDADPRTINDEPMLGDLESEALELVVGDYGIYSAGQRRLDDIALALANGHPVTCAVAGGSDAFQNYRGGVLAATGQPTDHYVCLLAFETGSDGRRVFTVRNSWGGDWGEAGNIRVAESLVAEMTDLVVLDVRKA